MCGGVQGKERFEEALRKSKLDRLVDAESGALNDLCCAIRDCQPFNHLVRMASAPQVD